MPATRPKPVTKGRRIVAAPSPTPSVTNWRADLLCESSSSLDAAAVGINKGRKGETECWKTRDPFHIPHPSISVPFRVSSDLRTVLRLHEVHLWLGESDERVTHAVRREGIKVNYDGIATLNYSGRMAWLNCGMFRDLIEARILRNVDAA